MAILKCKMCGGTLDYDRVQDLAVCPYCDSKYTIFEQDRKLFQQFQQQFAALLNQEWKEQNQENFWVEACREELLREDGETIGITYLTKRKTDISTMYVARHNVIFVFDSKYAYYSQRYQEMVSKLDYPTPEMERELAQYMPKLVTSCRLADGSSFVAIEKKEGVYPLKMLGILLDRHVAWVMSRLENLCCLLDYNSIVLNSITLDNLFVDPANHQIYLYGGWWFAGFQGAENQGASEAVKPYLERTQNSLWHTEKVKKARNQFKTDLESIRLVAANLLGYPNRNELLCNTLLPGPFRNFLLSGPEENARADFKKWDQVLIESYGERKFIPLSMTEEEIYSRSREEDK